MKRLLVLLVSLSAFSALAQDDPLAILNKNIKPTTVYSSATFKSTRIINGHSVETIAKNHLDFRISHRFGAINTGAEHAFGMDQATMRLGLEYGLSDRFMAGIGVSPTYSSGRMADYFGKYKVLRQSSGVKNMPVTVTLFGSVAASYMNSGENPLISYASNLERMTYTAQMLISRKISESFSLQISPTFIHRNKVAAYSNSQSFVEANDILALGVGGRIKISKRTSLNAEYFYRLPSIEKNAVLNPNYHNSLSIGFDIETGGHVFQLHFTNSAGMIEKQFIGETAGQWSKGDVQYGFNLSRTFSFDKEKKKSW